MRLPSLLLWSIKSAARQTHSGLLKVSRAANQKPKRRNAEAVLAAIGIIMAAMLHIKTILIRGPSTVQRLIVLRNHSITRTRGTEDGCAMTRKAVQPTNDEQEARAGQNHKTSAIQRLILMAMSEPTVRKACRIFRWGLKSSPSRLQFLRLTYLGTLERFWGR